MELLVKQEVVFISSLCIGILTHLSAALEKLE